MLGDRFCIQSNGTINVTLSPQDMVNCNFENYGCSGGLLVNTVDFLQTEGVTSEECMPYQDKDRSCSFTCSNGTKDYQKSKYFCKPGSLTILSSAEDIQTELITKGPMMVGLTVYEDFTNYKSGVYKHVTGRAVGGHAIKLIGWGHNDGFTNVTDPATNTTTEVANDGGLYWIC